MNIKQFDVVELNNKNKAIIKNKDGNGYFAEIINEQGNTIESRYILQEEIKSLIYSREKER